MTDVIIHRRDPRAFIVFPFKFIALVVFMHLLATCDLKKCLKHVHPIPAFLVLC